MCYDTFTKNHPTIHPKIHPMVPMGASLCAAVSAAALAAAFEKTPPWMAIFRPTDSRDQFKNPEVTKKYQYLVVPGYQSVF
jgi:L-alanine-DL-glutamate epimerase-like enolase superfamily enzyme